VVVPGPRRGAPATDAISVSVPVFRLGDGRDDELVAALLEEQARLAGLSVRRGP
jgi:DNA-binding IclR family transcriptional regulator